MLPQLALKKYKKLINSKRPNVPNPSQISDSVSYKNSPSQDYVRSDFVVGQNTF